MSKFIALIKTLIKTNNYLNIMDSKDAKKTYILSSILILSLAPIFYGVLKFTFSFYDTLVSVEQHGLVLSLSFSSISLLIFFSSIITVMSVMFFSMDLESLIPLPYTPRDLIASKFLVMLLYQYLIECFILLPVLIGFGIRNGLTLYYIFYSLISFTTLPIIPLSAASIVVMVVMRFTNLTKNKDQFKIFGGLIAIVLSIGIYLLIQDELGTVQTLSSIENMIALGNHSLVNLSSTLFPTTNLLVHALFEKTGFGNLLLLGKYLFYNFILFTIFLITGQLTYFNGLLGINESASKNKTISHKKMATILKEKPIQISYMLKEIRIILRTPAYLLNCVLGNFLWIILLISAYFSTDQIETQIKSVLQVFGNINLNHLILLSAILIVFLSGAFNSIVQTSISREGKDFMVNKYLPIHYKYQIYGKILSGVFFAGINILIITLVLIIYFKIKFFNILIFIVISLVSILYISLSGILIDLYNPKLHWTREQSAVKQNINVLLAFIPVILISFIIFLFSFIFDLSFYWIVLTSLVLFVLFNLIFYQLLMKLGIKFYNQI